MPSLCVGKRIVSMAGERSRVLWAMWRSKFAFATQLFVELAYLPILCRELYANQLSGTLPEGVSSLKNLYALYVTD